MALLLIAALAGLILPSFATTVTYPNVLVNGPVIVESKSVTGGLDTPKLSPGANETTYDWWYFDAVSTSTNESITVVFYNAGSQGFVNTYLGGPLSVLVTGSFSNGTTFALNAASPDGAVVTTNKNTISGRWKGSGFSFYGTGLATKSPTFVVNVDAPAIGIYGTITLKSVAPAHFPCGLDVSGAKEELLPNVFWSTAVPGAHAVVDLKIGGAPLHFTDGIGYHDKNWGDKFFPLAVTTWYWGHARVGPYTIGWFDAFDPAGEEFFSGYVAKDGKVLESSCAENAVVVRPWGANDEFPPTLSTGVPQGLEAVFDLGHGSQLVANVTTELVVVNEPAFLQSVGSVKATIKLKKAHHEVYEGRAFFDHFKFAAAINA